MKGSSYIVRALLAISVIFATAAVRAEEDVSGGNVVAQNPSVSPSDAEDSGFEAVYLPKGDLFKPLIADPKQPRFFASYRKYRYHAESINGAAVGYGEIFGIYRRYDKTCEQGWQIGIGGGLFAQFNLDAPSRDLVNADYTVGVPFSYRDGPLSARLSVYHQSSHLGDEFLLSAKPERINLSYESLDAVVSYEWSEWRGYLGGEYLFHRVPTDLDPAVAHGGIEYYSVSKMLGIGRLVGGLDLRSHQEHDWAVNASANAGFEFGKSDPGERYIRVLAEGYKGFAPHGQFYIDRISYYGIGIYFGF